LQALRESRAAILKLGLFRSVRFEPQPDLSNPDVVPIRLEVRDKPWHSLRIGAGYGTDDGFRGQIEWRSLNWLGDGRQLSVRLKGSEINREVGATFIQPHLLGPRNRGSIDFRLFQDDEETYLLNATQLIPRFQHDFTPTFTGFIGYRIEYDKVSDVDDATRTAIGGVETEGVLSAPLLGFLWNTADDLLNPTRGHVVSFQALQGGGIWGGPFNYWRSSIEGKKYIAIGWDVILAGRLELGLADSIGSIENLPIFERFYAGGERSVRGYGRRRLGPLSGTDRPLGGRSLLEGSVELRRPIWNALGGAVFLDFGNVSLDAFDPPVNDLKFAPGFGFTYGTPVGPLRLDIGFPLDPPPSDQSWQLHFSIGQFF
jgi:outer membrane protein insertion porin family/translocation and assembly module TamA